MLGRSLNILLCLRRREEKRFCRSKKGLGMYPKSIRLARAVPKKIESCRRAIEMVG